jgi:hypothetical protein
MTVDDFKVLLEFLGYIVRPFGVLVFGVAAGWLTVRTIKLEGQAWQLSVAALLGLLAAFVLLGHWVSGGGTLGVFGLGAGAGVLIWGMLGGRKPKDEEEED